MIFKKNPLPETAKVYEQNMLRERGIKNVVEVPEMPQDRFSHDEMIISIKLCQDAILDEINKVHLILHSMLEEFHKIKTKKTPPGK